MPPARFALLLAAVLAAAGVTLLVGYQVVPGAGGEPALALSLLIAAAAAFLVGRRW
ncbi:hypothetical protein ACFQXB_07790 [Plastorhodobacter daqingensis]|uniref:Uncharacterized protein n=1 Tax=Plastorhodobacter daqingensis TaxID=1387281 RepID=A0ABW2ULL1_9RHOB